MSAGGDRRNDVTHRVLRLFNGNPSELINQFNLKFSKWARAVKRAVAISTLRLQIATSNEFETIPLRSRHPQEIRFDVSVVLVGSRFRLLISSARMYDPQQGV